MGSCKSSSSPMLFPTLCAVALLPQRFDYVIVGGGTAGAVSAVLTQPIDRLTRGQIVEVDLHKFFDDRLRWWRKQLPLLGAGALPVALGYQGFTHLVAFVVELVEHGLGAVDDGFRDAREPRHVEAIAAVGAALLDAV